MGKKKDFLDWWNDRLNVLARMSPLPEEVFDYIVKKFPHAVNFLYLQGSWTAIKLAIIAYYQDVYTIIAKKHFGKICYVDAFAGSGIVKIKDHGRLLYGSPILAILVPRQNKKFDKLFFIELDMHRTMVLKEIINYLAMEGKVSKDQVVIMNKDMNTVNYDKLLKDCDHSLVFLDPEGTEPHWTTVSNLLKLNIDFVMNFMTAGIRRIWGNYRRNPQKGSGYANRLTEFYGDETWKNASNEHDLLNIYLSKIKSIRSVIETIEVKGPRMFHYHIIFAFRRTLRGNPWLTAIRRLKERIERTKYDVFETVLDVFYGRIKPLW